MKAFLATLATVLTLTLGHGAVSQAAQADGAPASWCSTPRS
ncbi:hypothetical protein [Azospirillum sp. B506]|nr:hypothetical protein [Azospirillum sp. B506]